MFQPIYKNVWQGLQGISLDDLVTKDVQQMLRLTQFNVGFLLALNDLRCHMGASMEDLVGWIRNVLPIEFRERSCQPSVEKIANYLQSLNQSSSLDMKQLSETVSFDLFIEPASKKKEQAEKGDKEYRLCFIEDLMDPERKPKKDALQWDDFLAPVNLDNLVNGFECRVSWNEFNNGLLYALWRVNRLLNNGDEATFKKWLTLTSTNRMKDSDYSAMCNAAEAIHKHITKFPNEIGRLVAPIVIKKGEKPSGNDNNRERKQYQQTSSATTKQVETVKEYNIDEEDDITVIKETRASNVAKHKENKAANSLTKSSVVDDSRKRNLPVDLDIVPSKKMARVQPQKQSTPTPPPPAPPSPPIKPQLRIKDLNSLTDNSLSSTSSSNDNNGFLIQPSQVRDSSLPVITDVVGGAEASKILPSAINQSLRNDVTLTTPQGAHSIDPNLSNNNEMSIMPVRHSSLMATSSQSNVQPNNQLPFVSHPSMQFGNQSGVPLIPVLSPNGYMTMVPLSVKFPMANSSLPNFPRDYSTNRIPVIINNTNQPPANNANSIVREPSSSPSIPPPSFAMAVRLSEMERKLSEYQRQNEELKQINEKLVSQNVKGKNEVLNNSKNKKKCNIPTSNKGKNRPIAIKPPEKSLSEKLDEIRQQNSASIRQLSEKLNPSTNKNVPSTTKTFEDLLN